MAHYWYIDGSLETTVQTSVGETSSFCRFSNLAPGTHYTIRVDVYAYNPWRLLDSGSTTTKTEDAPPVATSYYAKVVLDGNGGTCNGNSTWSYDNYGPGWGSYADVSVYFSDPGFQKTGYTLVGWSESRNASTVDYGKSGSISIRATSASQNNPTTVRLYAVWKKGRPNNWYWTSTVSQGLTLNLTAYEWNNFISRIQEFATYRGVALNSAYLSSGVAIRGSRMMADQANAVRYLINQLNPPTSVPASVTPGVSTITAAFINGLRDSINSIP